MTKHTPGPWTVTPHPYLPIASIHHGPHDPGGVPICAVNMRSLAALSESGDSEDDANARLIAAAPELLAALVAIVVNARLAPDQRMGGATDAYSVPTDDIDAARAAITKAEEG
mgnify:CR=1 FL=1